MDLITVSAQIIGLKGKVDLFQSFIQRDVPNILEAMGDSELKAAKRHFLLAARASSDERELTIAITLLDAAYQKFRDASESNTWGDALKELGQDILASFVPFQLASSELHYYKVMKKAMACTMLIMTCYSYLGDRPMLNEYATRLKEDFAYYGGLVNYLKWIDEDAQTAKNAMSSLCKELGSDVAWTDVGIRVFSSPSDFYWIP